MATADVNGVAAGYVYDDACDRVQETANGVTTLFLTDIANPTGYAQPIEQKSGPTAAPSVTYVIGDRVLAQADPTGAISYLLSDGQGSTRAMTSPAGAVTEAFSYTAFGGALSFDPASAGTVFIFGGDAVYDSASGLYLPGDGTRPRDGFFFTQMDSASRASGDPQSLHKYLYADADPVIYNVPTGDVSLLLGTRVHNWLSRQFEASGGGAVPGSLRFRNRWISTILRSGVA